MSDTHIFPGWYLLFERKIENGTTSRFGYFAQRPTIIYRGDCIHISCGKELYIFPQNALVDLVLTPTEERPARRGGV